MIARSSLRDLADCDFVIEAITESLPVKLAMWGRCAIVERDAVFATNTSSLPVVDQAAATSRPGSSSGSLLNPAQVMKLIAVIAA